MKEGSSSNQSILPLKDVVNVKNAVWSHYASHRRSLPWRSTSDPYHIMVSEIMLQQTQVSRVIGKYQEFIAAFPTIASLARASLSDVMALWQGLGYNRRARFIREAARAIVADHAGLVPSDPAVLEGLPGIGRNTARAIAAYAFDVPTVYLETNIRTVLIHHFFEGDAKISDAALLPLAAAVLEADRPREWYSALMDYGSFLKRTVGNKSIRSAEHRRQGRFEGSRRAVRGAVLRVLVRAPRGLTKVALRKDVGDLAGPDVVAEALDALLKEGLVMRRGRRVVCGDGSSATAARASKGGGSRHT